MTPRALLFLAVASTFAILPAPAEVAPEPALAVYEIPAKGPVQLQRLLEKGLDVLAATRDGKLHVAATEADRQLLLQMGPVHLLQGTGEGARIAALDANLGAYRTYAEATSVLQALVAAHPTLASLSTIGQSHQMRAIHALKISDQVATDESEPEVLILGCHHARELMSVEIPLQFAEYLLGNYGSDPEVTQLVNEREIWIVPIMNPDGYVHVQNNHSGDNWTWWRKNRRNNGDGTFGVDPNRNYAYNWGHDDIGSRPETSSNVYRGPSPFSEPETRAVRDLCNGRQFVLWLSYHSYSELLLYPWGYAYDYTADHELFQRLGEEMAEANGYLVGNPATGAIYLTNGGSDDWAYGETASKPVIYGFTPEVGSFADGAFAPPESLIGPYFNLLLPMNMKCLELAGNPEKVLGPAPPAITTVQTAAEELVLGWTGNVPGDPNPATSYELRGFQLEGYPQLDAEGPSTWVSLDGGFATSTARAFSGSASYHSGMADNLSSTVTTVAPYRVAAATQTFTCRMWYAIELDYDYAYLEVSEDQGVTWRPISGNVTTNANPNGSNHGNGITGTSPGWVLASFSLAAYLGQEIQLRIRYDTDGAVLEEGVYVDLLDPVPAFGLHGTIATGIPGTSHAFVPADLGSWLYQVRGTDLDGDASRWSPGFDVQVDDPIDARVVPPSHTMLWQNVPNPFNPRTTILFAVGARPGEVTERPVDLAIHDAAGRRIVTLVHAALPPGHHRSTWDGTASDGTPLRSGIYFARLQVDGEATFSRKLVLLK